MGITGLLPELQDEMALCHIGDEGFTGRVAGVDASIYIFKGGLTPTSCSPEKGIQYACRVIKQLKDAGIHVIMVFDGEKLEAKAPAHARRRAAHEKQKTKLQELKNKQQKQQSSSPSSSKELSEDITRLEKTINFQPNSLRNHFIKYCREKNVEYVIAPYEADAQLASMAMEGVIDFVITEDSDLVVFGCKYILYKLDNQGYGMFYDKGDLPEALGIPIGDEQPFSFKDFQDRCILSGCDYADSLPGIGIKKSKDILDDRNTRKNKSLAEAIQDFDPRFTVGQIQEYLQTFRRAQMTFRHQVVYSVKNKRFQYLHPLPNGTPGDVSYLGVIPSNVDAEQYSIGNFDFHSQRSDQDLFVPNPLNYRRHSIYASKSKSTRCMDIIPTRLDERPIYLQEKPDDNKYNLYCCDECGHSCPSKQAMESHLIVIHGVRKANNICNQCGQHFVRTTHLKRHELIHTGEKKYSCNDCKEKFAQAGTLKKHRRIHTKEKPFKCRNCDKAFTAKSRMVVHRRTHTGEKPYRCYFCSNNRPFKSKFADRGSLRNHLRTHTKEKPYKCDKCHLAFATSYALNVHKRTHSGEKPYQCEICQRRFATSGDLNIHIRTHSGDKPYKCEECGKSFTKSDILKVHERTHSGEKPYQCEICQRRFATRNALKVHIRTHTGDKPYKCDKCGKAFTQSSTLKYHERTHTGDKPFQCDNCDKQFRTSSAVRQHSVVHTGKRSDPCPKCGKTFSRKDKLTQHLKNIKCTNFIDAKV